MLVITSPAAVNNEASIINGMFNKGLSILHVRKPDITQLQLAYYIKDIDEGFHNKLVLHQHYNLINDFDVKRLHRTYKNLTDFDVMVQQQHNNDLVFSASAHSVYEFNNLPQLFSYAFLSPVYNSISKPGYLAGFNKAEVSKSRTNFNIKLIALGGISNSNCREAISLGFDGVAFLGAIWNIDNPMREFIKCQKTLSYNG